MNHKGVLLLIEILGNTEPFTSESFGAAAPPSSLAGSSQSSLGSLYLDRSRSYVFHTLLQLLSGLPRQFLIGSLDSIQLLLAQLLKV